MDGSRWETTEAWHELLEGLAGLEGRFAVGADAFADERSVAEGYRMLMTALGVASDVYLFAESGRPTFVEINNPFRRDRRWGGDNTDAYYSLAALDPARTYLVTGRRGDSVYFSLTVYNEPSPGAWSNRVLGLVNDSDLDFDADGRFALMLGPARPDDWTGPFLELGDDTHVAFTRDYQDDPAIGRPVTWKIEAVDAGPVPIPSDRVTAARLRAVLAWVQTLFATVPMAVASRDAPEALGHNTPQLANEFADPYQVPDANFGWSARDACYAFASFRIEEDEALVVTHRPPECRFWNLVVWNRFLATDVPEDARTSINGGLASPNSDGTVTILVSRRQLEHPNAVSTGGRAEGAVALRWFLPDVVPERPTVQVVRVADAPASTT